MGSGERKLRGWWRWRAWDPRLLMSQIVALQALGYTSHALLAAAAQDISGAERSLDHIFAYHEVHVRSSVGLAVVCACLLQAGVLAVALWMLVGRTKLCLDFTCTYYGIHVLACWWYNGGAPHAVGWWALQVACAVVTCVAAEFLSLRTELQEIPLSNIGAKVDL